MADTDEGAMEKEVHMIVQIIVRKGEPLPEETARLKSPGSEDEECERNEGEATKEESDGEAAQPKPTLEELGVKFVLTTFNGVSLERYDCVRLYFISLSLLLCLVLFLLCIKLDIVG